MSLLRQGMPWRTRTVRPLSLRGGRCSPDTRPPLRLVNRRIPDGESYTDRPIWQLAHLSQDARTRLAALAPVCAAWEARLVDEAEITGLVLVFRPWPRDVSVHLSDDPQLGEACTHTPVVALTRHRAMAVWGSAEAVGFEALADLIYDERDARAAPDLDALGTLAP